MVKKPVSHQFQPSRIDAKTADVIESKAPVKREESAPAGPVPPSAYRVSLAHAERLLRRSLGDLVPVNTGGKIYKLSLLRKRFNTIDVH